jgi:hypothetical protein
LSRTSGLKRKSSAKQSLPHNQYFIIIISSSSSSSGSSSSGGGSSSSSSSSIIITIIIIIIIDFTVLFFKNFAVVQLVKASFVLIGFSSRVV